MKRKTLIPLALAFVMVFSGPATLIHAETADTYTGLLSDEAVTVGSLPIQGHEAVPLSGLYSPSTVEHMLEGNLLASTSDSLESAYPAGYDDSGLLSDLKKIYPHVRDQSPFGSCWAHATIGSAESNMIKENGGNTGIDYSEAHLVHYTYNTADNPVLSEDHEQSGDSITHDFTEKQLLNYGGHIMLGNNALSHWKGVVDDSYAPYDESPIKDWSAIDAFSGDIAVETAWYAISLDNPDLIKAWIRDHGGVGVAYYSSDDTGYYSNKNNCYYYPEEATENHSVMIVGWDDNFPRTSFKKTPGSDGAWLIRNSWGENDLSEYGYFWMSYEDKTLGGSTGSVFASVMSPKYADNNYFYDCNFHNWMKASDTAANIFRINGNETEELVSVGFYYEHTDTVAGKANVTVYSGFDENDPTSGRKLCEETGISLPYLGYYTVNFEEPPVLQKGEEISVVVEVTGGVLGQESDFTYWPGFDAVVSSNPGESFTYDADSNKWNDCGTDGNICISAQTKNVFASDTEYGEGYTPEEATDKEVSIGVGNGRSVTIDYKSAVEFTGKKIDPATGLGAETDISDFIEGLPNNLKNSASKIAVKYVCNSKAAGQNSSFYVKLKLKNTGSLSTAKKKALKKAVKKANKKLKKNPCTFTINRRSLMHGTITLGKKNAVSFTFPETGYAMTLPSAQYSIIFLDSDTEKVQVKAAEKNFSGLVTVLLN